MPFSVSAYIDDHLVTVPAETAKKAFAKAVEWQVVRKLAEVSISDGIKHYSIAEFSSLIATGGLSKLAERTVQIKLPPTLDLPDDTPLQHVQFSTRIQNALMFGGCETVGDVRKAPDMFLLSLQDLGKGSVRQLREKLGTGKKK